METGSVCERGRLGWEFATIYWRDMIRFFRFRALLFSSLVQPALWMAFFGVAMSANFDKLLSNIPIPPGAVRVEYLTFMGAGVIAMTTLFTSLFGGISLLFDKNWGLMREMLASPMPRNHIVAGIGLSGVTKSFIQVGVIMAFGVAIGVRFFQGYGALEVVTAVLGMLAFVTFFSLSFLFLSATISMRLTSPEGVQGVITLLTMPIFFASNALYPVDAFPEVLKVMSRVNPLTHFINGLRYFAIGHDFYAIGTHYVYRPGDVLFSFGVLVVFAGLTFALAWWTFRKAVITG